MAFDSLASKLSQIDVVRMVDTMKNIESKYKYRYIYAWQKQYVSYFSSFLSFSLCEIPFFIYHSR